MIRSLLFLMFFGSVGYANAQSAPTYKEVIIAYQTFSLADENIIRAEASLHPEVKIKEVCYNHNAIVFQVDPAFTDINSVLIRHLKALKTSSMPEYKDGDSNGLECDTQVPANLIEQSNKQ